MTVRIYVQSHDEDILDDAYGTVFNMALHDRKWLNWIKDMKKPFLLVHGGFQNRMASYSDIIDFSLKHSPELVIAPDIYRDQRKTSSMTVEFCNLCPERLLKKVAGVIQGGLESVKPVTELYDRLGLKWIAIPSDNRAVLPLSADLRERGWKVHVLGAREFTLDADSVDIVVSSWDEYMKYRAIPMWRR